MSTEFQPRRHQGDLAEVVEMLLDKGIVINADIAVSIGDTQLLGVQLRAAIASFETAAKYGLEFPEGTDMRRVAAAAGEPELAEMDRPAPPIDPTRSVNVTPNETEGDGEDSSESETEDGSSGGEEQTVSSVFDGLEGFETGTETESDEDDRGTERFNARPDPREPTSGGFDLLSDESDADGADGDSGAEEANRDEDENAEATSGEAPDT